jgi:hypothetical protein
VTIRILKTLKKKTLKKVTKIASYQFAQVALENELVAYILPVNIHNNGWQIKNEPNFKLEYFC